MHRRIATMMLMGLAGCTATPPPAPPVVTVPPSLGPRYETTYVDEAVHPALRSSAGLTKNQLTSFLYEEDRVYAIRGCYAGRQTSIKLPPGEELTGETIASFGDADPLKWGITAKKGGKQWIVSVAAKVRGLETDMVVTTNVAAYPFEITAAYGCHKIVAIVHPKKVAVKREVPADYDAAAINANYTVRLKKGAAPAWMPLRAFDMGKQKIWIEFPAAPGAVGAPAVVAGSPVIPRIDGNFYQVDTAASSVELRLNKSVVLVEKGSK